MICQEKNGLTVARGPVMCMREALLTIPSAADAVAHCRCTPSRLHNDRVEAACL